MFSEIETRRELAGIDQSELCKRAGVHPTTYTARKNGRTGMREATIARLAEALDALLEEKGINLELAKRETRDAAE